MSDYLSCVDQNGRCGHPFHDRARMDGDTCSKATAWKKAAKPCPGCGTLVPECLGERLSPRVVTEFAANNVKKPTLPGTHIAFFLKVMQKDEFICGDCATTVRKLVPGGFLVELKDGTPLPPFVDAATYNRLTETKKREERARADQVAKQKAEETRKATEAEAKRKKDEADAALRRLATLNDMLGHMLGDGLQVRFSGVKNAPEGKLTECALHANAPKLCICEGWHNWDHMPALMNLTKGMAFGFGSKCAMMLSELSERPLQFPVNYAAAIAAFKSGDPKKFLDERAKRRDREEHVSVTVGPERRFHPHEYGTGKPKTPKLPKVQPKVLSPEEQRKKDEEVAQERQRRHLQRLAKAQEIAMNPAAGAMPPKPPKQKAQKSGDKDKKKRRGGQKSQPQQANAK